MSMINTIIMILIVRVAMMMMIIIIIITYKKDEIFLHAIKKISPMLLL
jgi:hypothetical protein